MPGPGFISIYAYAQKYADEEFVKMVSYLNDLAARADGIVAFFDGWND